MGLPLPKMMQTEGELRKWARAHYLDGGDLGVAIAIVEGSRIDVIARADATDAMPSMASQSADEIAPNKLTVLYVTDMGTRADVWIFGEPIESRWTHGAS